MNKPGSWGDLALVAIAVIFLLFLIHTW